VKVKTVTAADKLLFNRKQILEVKEYYIMKKYVKLEVSYIKLSVILHHCGCSAGDDNPYPTMTPFFEK